MRNFKKTAIALGVAQIAFMSSNPLHAQEAAEPAASGASAVVVVTGQRAALQSAQKIKQNSDEVVDSIVADDIGKLPDRSITEVLQRIVGVTMDRTMAGDPQHYAVEGSGISIRGLTYVRSELNGRDSFSANGGRSLNFEDVPPELMAGVDVYKNPSAEQTEGAISGLVNLRTKLPFDSKGFKAAATVEGTYSTLRKGKTSPSYSVLLSDRWKTGLGEFGALIDFAHSESNTRTDAYQLDPLYPRDDLETGRRVWVPKGLLWRTTEFEREREGKYAALQWRPFAGLTNTLTWFRSDYQMSWSEQALLMQHTAPFAMGVRNGQYNDAGAFIGGTLYDTTPNSRGINFNADRRVAERESATTDIGWKTEWRVTPTFTLRADLQSIKARTDGFDSDVATGLELPSQTMDLSGKLPTVTFTDAERAYLADPKNYYWAYTMEHLDKASADSKALKLDGQYDFDNPILRDVRFGVRFTDRNARTENTNPSYNWQGITQPWMTPWRIKTVADLGRFPNETRLHEFSNFFGGDATVPQVVFPNDSLARGYPESYRQLHEYQQILCRENGQTCTPWPQATFGNNPAGINNVDEKTKALFTQLRFGFDDMKFPIDGNIGIRYVKTDTTADGYTVYTPTPFNPPAGANVTGVPIPNIAPIAQQNQYSNGYHNWLPSLNLKLKASDTLQFRLAMGSALSRPNFSALQGYTSLSRGITSTNIVDTATNTTREVRIENVALTGTSSGNPMLKPTTARQIDVTAEWYPAPGKSLTLAIFNKQLKDIVVNQLSTFSVADVGGTNRDFLVTAPVNGAKGFARGFELAGQTYFDNLPEWASGLGVQASFTFVDSERELYNPVKEPWCTGAADGATNLNLFVNGCDTNGQSFENLPLEGLSRRTVNFALLYDKGPISARLAYNWRSRNMQQVAAWGVRQNDGRDLNPANQRPGVTPASIYYGLPLWADDYGQLDAGFSYKVNDNISIGVDAQNLNDAVFKQDMQQHVGMIGHAWFATGPRYSAKLMVNF